MKSIDKIAILIAVSIVDLLSVTLALGFIIGGRFGLIHLIASVILCMVSVLCIMKILKKDIAFKKDNMLNFLAIIGICVVTVYFSYSALNRMGASNEYTDFDTVITEQYRSCYKFYDGKQEIECTDMRIIVIEDEYTMGVGSNITMRKREGLFGYTVYSLVSVNSDPTGY